MFSRKTSDFHRQLLCQSFHVSGLFFIVTLLQLCDATRIHIFFSMINTDHDSHSLRESKRHYRPVGYPADKMQNEIHYSVPPHWSQQLPPVEGLDELEVVGTSFKEPNCKNLFCSVDESNENSKYLVNWHGPAPKGKIVTNGWDPVTMTPPENLDETFSGGNREITAAKRILENEAHAGSDEL